MEVVGSGPAKEKYKMSAELYSLCFKNKRVMLQVWGHVEKTQEPSWK